MYAHAKRSAPYDLKIPDCVKISEKYKSSNGIKIFLFLAQSRTYRRNSHNALSDKYLVTIFRLHRSNSIICFN